MWRLLRRLGMHAYHAVGRPHAAATRFLVKEASINGYRMLVFVNEDVGCKIYCYREFERDESMLIARVIREEAICVDVGAHVGYYTLLFASKASRGEVHSFEPVPRSFYLLSTNVLTNGFYNVTLNCCALGNVDGEMSFTVSKDSAYSSLVDTERKPRERVIRVPVKSLDSYCRERALRRIDFLKVDVEGAEKMVLEGALGCLEDVHLKPKIMMLELYEPMLQKYSTSIEEIVRWLGDFGYSPFICHKRQVIPFERAHYNRFWNVFFTEDPSLLQSG
jgi:FkbM family methyltransferase